MSGVVKIIEVSRGFFFTTVLVEAVEDCHASYIPVGGDRYVHRFLGKGKRKVVHKTHRCTFVVGDVAQANKIL